MKTLADTLAVLAFGILLCGCRTVDSATQAECLIDFTYCQGARLNGLSLLGRNLGTNVHGILTKPHETNEKPGKWKREDFPAIERCMVRGFTGNGITVGGNDASMQKAVPTPECGLIINKLNCAVITGNRLVGTRQALLDLGEHGEQVIIHENITQIKPPPAGINN